MSTAENRFARQEALVPSHQLKESAATVIGVGAIGRQLALQLAAIGVPRLQLIDFDIVTPTNVTSQGYLADDARAGRLKVDATTEVIQRIDPTIDVQPVRDRYRPQHALHPAVFCCVDSISARAAIWRSGQERVRFWADGRMLGEVIRILAVSSPSDCVGYSRTLFRQEEAHSGSCASRSTIYAAAIAAGLMVHQFTRWLREMPVDFDTTLNLLASEFSVLP
jgi:sulfur carrier protein ThiS adenylyltransferase